MTFAINVAELVQDVDVQEPCMNFGLDVRHLLMDENLRLPAYDELHRCLCCFRPVILLAGVLAHLREWLALATGNIDAHLSIKPQNFVSFGASSFAGVNDYFFELVLFRQELVQEWVFFPKRKM